jgi:hypothetical protein
MMGFSTEIRRWYEDKLKIDYNEIGGEMNWTGSEQYSVTRCEASDESLVG